MTPEDDYNRLAERIWNRGRGRIRTREDYDAVFSTYMKDSRLHGQTALSVSDRVFRKVERKHGLEKYRGMTRTEDAAQREIALGKLAAMPSKNEFEFRGYSGKRQAYLRRTVFEYRGRTVTVYRDSKGRFGRLVKK